MNFNFLKLSFYYRLFFKSLSPADFPLKKNITFKGNNNYIGSSLFKDKSKSQFTFLYGDRISESSRKINQHAKLEILYGVIDKKLSLDSKSNELVIPLAAYRVPTEVTIRTTSGEERKLALNQKQINYFHFKELDLSSIISNKKMFIGNPIDLNQPKKTKYKLVVQVFIDGLSTMPFVQNNDPMPYTSAFFNGGINHKNCYSNGEWTLPSSASIVTGKYTHHHGLYHPKKHHQISSKVKLVSEFFKDNDYLTFFVSSNWRQSPLYGYNRDFDRIVYSKNNLKSNQVIEELLDQIKAFPKRSIFAFITLFDLHEVFYRDLPSIDLQVNNYVDFSADSNLGHSVISQENPTLTNHYINRLNKIDTHLKLLYDFIAQNYEDEEVLVNLVSDHGQSYLSDGENILGSQRTSVKYLLNKKPKSSMEKSIMENVDILPTLLSMANIKFNPTDFDGSSIFKVPNSDLELTYSESIFPGQSYKAFIRSGNWQYYFETNKIMEENLKINLEDSKIEKFTESGKLCKDINSEDMKFVKKIIQTKLSSSDLVELV